MTLTADGPASALFQPVRLSSRQTLRDLERAAVTDQLKSRLSGAPRGSCVCRGIPFLADRILIMAESPATIPLAGLTSRWLVFLHASDVRPLETNAHGFHSPMAGEGRLGELACTYRIRYGDGTEAAIPIRRRREIGCFTRRWGENCFEAVPYRKPRPVRASHEQLRQGWGSSQTRVDAADEPAFLSWLCAWENPRPDLPMESLCAEPSAGTVVLFGISAGSVDSNPLVWEARRKALLTLREGERFSHDLDEQGLFAGARIDLGQVISALPRAIYPDGDWESSYNNKLPVSSTTQVLLEYTAHPEACFHLAGGRMVPVSELREDRQAGPLVRVAPSTKRVRLTVVEKGSGKPVPVKLHAHGMAGEYLAPVDRHRIPNPAWYEDYSVDFVHCGAHWCTYIPGESTIDLPVGTVFLEIAKGFEIRPIRMKVEVDGSTDEIVVELDRVLPWRERGWVTADTHVHFLSPASALLEGSAEGLNVVNLLASQWGELMTNVGDFDGSTTWGSREAGGDGEHLVRVGTENRQHVLGHISLLGYGGPIIAPMTTGGPDESALGDPIEILLSEWARQCRSQGGLVVLPHFPHPRAEHAAALINGDVDAVEMTSMHYRYLGIDPYSLSDWYRYLNCGYLVPAVGGTDKMAAATAVGTVRTYAHIDASREFNYETWKEAVRGRETFVTYGPLLEFAVDGHPMGSRIAMSSHGGTIDVVWQAASVTVPMSRVELVVNGEIRESVGVAPDAAAGGWSVRIAKSSWLALLVRGHYPDQPEIIAAHSTPVMIDVEGFPLVAAADAVTILDQIEGAMVYLDTVGTRADDRVYKRMRLTLESAHRTLHNRLHQRGYFHEHSLGKEH